MALFKYIGPYQRTYPDIVVGGHVLVVEPDEQADFAEPPSDGWWVPVETKKSPAKGRGKD